MLHSRTTSASEHFLRTLQPTTQATSQTDLSPGEKVEVLDMCGRPTGILCKVQSIDAQTVGVIWGGETIPLERSRLRKAS
jgi:hypothetical protein